MSQSLFTTVQAANFLGLKKSTLDCWRVRGQGPRFKKFGAAVRYALADLERYVEQSSRTSTSDPGNVQRIRG